MWSSSPCHHRTGTVTSAAVNPQSRVNSSRSLSGAEVWNRLPLSRSSRNIALNSGRDSRFLSPGGWTAAYRSSAVPASGLTSRIAWVSADAERDPGDLEQRRQPHGELDRTAVDRVRAAGGCDAAEDADAVHPLREVGARGERVGAAAGQADQPAGVDGERVEEQLEVAGPVADPAVEVRRRRADPGSVHADDAEAVLVGVPPGLERDLAPGAGGAVHPDDRGAARRAVLREAEPAAVAHRDGALEGRALRCRSRREVSQSGRRLDAECERCNGQDDLGAARLPEAHGRRVDDVPRVEQGAEQLAVADHGRPVDQVDDDAR